MATSFGALCTDFYINHKLAVKMDLPADRETVLQLFDRVRNDQPNMRKFRRYPDELALESSRHEGTYQWLALRDNNVRSGYVNPDSLDVAYSLHQLILKLAPYYLSVSPLDVDYLELMFGFDFETNANQHEVVYEALFADSPLASLLTLDNNKPIDVQPIFGISLSERCDLQAFFEVKTSTSVGQIRRNKFRTEPLSVFLTIRRMGAVDSVDDLVEHFATLRHFAEQLASERVVPDLIGPINRVLTSSA